jgi:hypothetical protein
MNDDIDFFAMRQRAYELAESGRYKRWGKIAAVLKSEGFAKSSIVRFADDGLAVMMIARCCEQASA